MRISFHGAAREVTGSCHLVEVAGSRVLLDCGMIQGGRERHVRNREPFPFDPASIDHVVLSHAHVDHCGRLPLLAKNGFRGRILSTQPTRLLAEILLSDSGHIQEEDARYARRRRARQGEDVEWVKPLYTEQEALGVMPYFDTAGFGEWRQLGEAVAVRFHMAGHILGAAVVELRLTEGAKTSHLVFSGDLGIDDARLLSAPAVPPCPDWLIMESTYGNRIREDEGDRTEALASIIEKTVQRRGKVIIPAFAVGRTQEVLARLNDLVEGGRLMGVPVFVDSPMAVDATRLFARFPEAWSPEARSLYRAGDAPLDFPRLKLVTRVEDSIALNEMRGPAVIISASGMCTAGRIKHHLAHNISDPECTVLFVGYQARGTLGHVILSGIDPVRIHGQWYPVRARVTSMDSFSAHADRNGLLAWHAALGGSPRRTFLVHGDPEPAAALARELRERHHGEVVIPELGDGFELN